MLEDGTEAAAPGQEARVVYRHPLSGGMQERTMTPADILEFGRAPGPGGLVLDRLDLTISATAGRIRWASGSWLLENTGSHAHLQLVGGRGLRYLAPGVADVIQTDDVVVIPGRDMNHELQTHLLNRAFPTSPSGNTETESDAQLVLTPDQLRAVAAMVVGYFAPKRFPPEPLPTEVIRGLLTKAGDDASERGVNARLQKARESLGSVLDTFHSGVGEIPSRALLAQYVVAHDIVTLELVHDLFGF